MADINPVVNSAAAAVVDSARVNKINVAHADSAPKAAATDSLKKEFDPIEFRKAVEQIDEFLKSNAKPRMSIAVDETLNRPVVKLKDPDGGHVRTIPSEEVIRISQNIELMKGIFFDAKS